MGTTGRRFTTKLRTETAWMFLPPFRLHLYDFFFISLSLFLSLQPSPLLTYLYVPLQDIETGGSSSCFFSDEEHKYPGARSSSEHDTGRQGFFQYELLPSRKKTKQKDQAKPSQRFWLSRGTSDRWSSASCCMFHKTLSQDHSEAHAIMPPRLFD